MKIIETERLILRTLQEEDALSFFKIHQDPKLTEFIEKPFTLDQVHDFIKDSTYRQNQYGYSAWVIELKTTNKLIGFINLFNPTWEAHFTPATAIGWCIDPQYWGSGYAPEGAKAAINYGFNRCELKEIVSFTVPTNKASIRVMEKISMQRDFQGDFAHPELPPDHKLSKHILYRISNHK